MPIVTCASAPRVAPGQQNKDDGTDDGADGRTTTATTGRDGTDGQRGRTTAGRTTGRTGRGRTEDGQRRRDGRRDGRTDRAGRRRPGQGEGGRGQGGQQRNVGNDSPIRSNDIVPAKLTTPRAATESVASAGLTQEPKLNGKPPEGTPHDTRLELPSALIRSGAGNASNATRKREFKSGPAFGE